MPKKPYSAKHEKKLPNQKKVQELAEDDYIPTGNDSFHNNKRAKDE